MVNYIFNLLFGLMALHPLVPNHATTIGSTNMFVAKPVLLTWEMLFKVIMVEKYSTRYKMKVMAPEFDITLQKLNTREVTISGFVIPTGINSNIFALSQNPFSSCYFCGNGGPETVMSIKYNGKPPKYKTDDYITLKGVFQLNSTDINELIYILKNAVQVK